MDPLSRSRLALTPAMPESYLVAIRRSDVPYTVVSPMSGYMTWPSREWLFGHVIYSPNDRTTR